MMLFMVLATPSHGRPTLWNRTLRTLTACCSPVGYTGTIIAENERREEDVVGTVVFAQAHPALQLRNMHDKRSNKSHAIDEVLTIVEVLATVDDGLVALGKASGENDTHSLNPVFKWSSGVGESTYFAPRESTKEREAVESEVAEVTRHTAYDKFWNPLVGAKSDNLFDGGAVRVVWKGLGCFLLDEIPHWAWGTCALAWPSRCERRKGVPSLEEEV